jgi:DNA-directed RNA polymerase
LIDLKALEAKKTVDRFFKQQDQIMAQAGHGDTDAALSITKEYLGVLSSAISAKTITKLTTPQDRQIKILIDDLGHDQCALLTLQGCLHSIALDEPFRGSLLRVGKMLEGECWAAKLTNHNPKVAAQLVAHAKRRYGTVARRQDAVKQAALKIGFKQRDWSRRNQLLAGAWLLDCALAALPTVFLVSGSDEDKCITLHPEAEKLATEAQDELMKRRPVFLPMLEEPVPWSAFDLGGPRDQRRHAEQKLLRTHWPDVEWATKLAIKTGQAMPALDAVNSLQAVAWTINQPVLTIIQACIDQGIAVKGLPGANIPAPAKVKPWEELTDGEKRLWKLKSDRTKTKNQSLVGERLMLKEDIETARLLSSQAFYTPMNMDWRGRIYAMCQFNFQREDRVRALFQFSNGEALGEDGLWWLKVHVANCGDFDKISKQPLAARVAWVDQNLNFIQETAHASLTAVKWRQADKPFLFLEACLELTAAIAEGSTYLTHLPISFDGSCSGLQHLCAMTRAPEGSLVNLTPSTTPQDVYTTVAARVVTRVEQDASTPVASPEEDKAWVPVVAQLALDHGIDRDLVKRNVMTYAYSSKKFGMAAQQQTDKMDTLEEEVLTGEREEHPFLQYAEGKIDRPSTAARYLAGHVYTSIEETITRPAQAMAFLQGIARALAHENKPAVWVTPSGLPWINRYHTPEVNKVTLWMHDRGVRVRHQIMLAEGHKNEINKSKAAAAVAPNFVHALDAAHLSLTVNAAVREGCISIATVHDSFGCLAPRAKRFNQIIREEFARMYTEHDVLAEILGAAKRDLTVANWGRLPKGIEYGSLDINQVKQSEFAFA